MEMRKKHSKKFIIIFSASVILVVFVLVILISLFVFLKKDEEEIASIEELTETIPVEKIEKPDPNEIISSAAYNNGIMERASSYKEGLISIFPDITEDLARFSLIDIDKDGIPELVMHDVIGKAAYYCSFTGGEMSMPVTIYEASEVGEDTYSTNAYAALYKDYDVFVRYEFSDGRNGIKSFFYRLDDNTKQPLELGSLSVRRSEDEYSFEDGNGNALSQEEYKDAFRSYLGDECFNRFFDTDLMIADGEYDFRSEFLWADSEGIQMTYDELEEKCSFR